MSIYRLDIDISNPVDIEEVDVEIFDISNGIEIENSTSIFCIIFDISSHIQVSQWSVKNQLSPINTVLPFLE